MSYLNILYTVSIGFKSWALFFQIGKIERAWHLSTQIKKTNNIFDIS